MSAYQINLWAIVTFGLGVIAGLYIMIFGAPDPVLSDEGKKAIQWYLRYEEEQIGRFATACLIILGGAILSIACLLTPVGWTEFSD